MKKLVHSFDNSGDDIDSIDSVNLTTTRSALVHSELCECTIIFVHHLTS